MTSPFTSGQVPTAGEIDALATLFAYKTSDEQVISSTTNQDDDHLFAPVASNSIYRVFFHLVYSAHSSADIRIGWVGPTGAVFRWGALGQVASNTGLSGTAFYGSQDIAQADYEIGGAGAENTTFMGAWGFGMLRTSSTAGTFKLQWSQGTSNATGTIMRADSWLSLNLVVV